MNPIRQMRDKLGFSKYKMAAELGMPQQAYERLEASRQGYRYTHYVYQLADMAKVNLTDLKQMFSSAPEKIEKFILDKSKE